ncbi:uracil-DNA glycosylase [Novosphingobium sp.]|uniref:uracil-DNA glycosylase n=1 Tax=Novosphingobium sp. TaxID=1874826 RepID=UPI003BACA126
MTPLHFVSQLAALRFANAFNPYSDRCAVHDIPDAPTQRATTLTAMLHAAEQTEVDALWVGRDLGFRGGRRTGLALTDDVHYHTHLERWGLRYPRPTVGQPVPEKTATVIWNMVDQIRQPIFFWNVFPLHPHEHDAPFTNRAHNARERHAGTEVLHQLIKLLRPRRLIAVGNDAENVLTKFDGFPTTIKVRHPSYGGQTEFSRQIRAIYDIREQTLL